MICTAANECSIIAPVSYIYRWPKNPSILDVALVFVPSSETQLSGLALFLLVFWLFFCWVHGVWSVYVVNAPTSAGMPACQSYSGVLMRAVSLEVFLLRSQVTLNYHRECMGLSMVLPIRSVPELCCTVPWPGENVRGHPRFRSASTGCVSTWQECRRQSDSGISDSTDPALWNSLPSAVHDSSLSLNTFVSTLKTSLRTVVNTILGAVVVAFLS